MFLFQFHASQEMLNFPPLHKGFCIANEQSMFWTRPNVNRTYHSLRLFETQNNNEFPKKSSHYDSPSVDRYTLFAFSYFPTFHIVHIFHLAVFTDYWFLLVIYSVALLHTKLIPNISPVMFEMQNSAKWMRLHYYTRTKWTAAYFSQLQ